ncbi:MAG: hypothetical protein WBD25_04725 [Terriglobales bacterium]|jgi:hypothetical protein
MQRKIVRTITLRSFALVVVLITVPIVVPIIVLGTMWQAQAQDTKTFYPSMAPLEQYLIADRNDEISLARSAAPESISRDAEVLVLGRHGYETAVKGKNGFVCMVERSWTAGIDDPDFWNPKVRGAICFNPAGARSQIPITLKKTELVLAGQSSAQMAEGIKAAFDRKELATPEPGAMCYMLSKQAYLSDRDGHWHPHLMFFVPQTDTASWGANLHGSPILGITDAQDRLTLFLIPVGEWSDGTAAPMK